MKTILSALMTIIGMIVLIPFVVVMVGYMVIVIAGLLLAWIIGLKIDIMKNGQTVGYIQWFRYYQNNS